MKKNRGEWIYHTRIKKTYKVLEWYDWGALVEIFEDSGKLDITIKVINNELEVVKSPEPTKKKRKKK